MYDLSGKMIMSKSIKELQTNINTEGLAGGIYFFKVITSYKTENFKIIIQP